MPLILNGDGSVGPLSATEVGYLDGVTAPVQTQINSKTNVADNGLVFLGSYSFTASSAWNVNNVFTSTYDNYRIVLKGTSQGTQFGTLVLRLRAGGSDYTSNAYSYGMYTSYETGGSGGTGAASTSSFALFGGWQFPSGATIDLISPRLAEPTVIFSQGVSMQGTNIVRAFNVGGTLYDNYQADGFSIIAAGGLTGNVRIYGYRN